MDYPQNNGQGDFQPPQQNFQPQQQPYGQSYGQQPYNQQPDLNKNNGMCVASLVLSLISIVFIGGICSILGIIFGAVGISKVKKTGQKGYNLGMAGLVIGIITFALGIIISFACILPGL